MDSGDQLASFPACAFSGPRRYYTPVYTRRGRGMEEEYSLTGQLCPSGQETDAFGLLRRAVQIQVQRASRKQYGDYRTQYRLNVHEQVFRVTFCYLVH